MRKPAASVEEYLDAVPEPARSTVNKVRAAIRAAVPAEATEKLSYGVPTFHYLGMLLSYAAFEKHCSIFPGPAIIETLREELSSYDMSKGTVRFPVDKPPPAALVKKMAKLRVAQNELKLAAKASSRKAPRRTSPAK